MNSTDLLRRAAAAMCGPSSYDPKNTELVSLATKHAYGATGALERANTRLRSGAVFCARGDDAVLQEAKSRVCKVVGFPHLDLWEWVKKPTWLDVRQAFQEAAA